MTEGPCYLARHGIYERGPMPPCDGWRIKAHLIPKSLLKRELNPLPDVLWDRRVWVWACGGPTGCGGHHGMFDQERSLRLRWGALPPGLVEFAREHGLLWWLLRTYAP